MSHVTKGTPGARTLTARSEEMIEFEEHTEGRFVLQRFLHEQPFGLASMQAEWFEQRNGYDHLRTNSVEVFYAHGDDRDAVIGEVLDQLSDALVHGKRNDNAEGDAFILGPRQRMAGAVQLLGRNVRLGDELRLAVLRPFKVFSDVVTDHAPLDDRYRPGEPLKTTPFFALLEVSLIAKAGS